MLYTQLTNKYVEVLNDLNSSFNFTINHFVEVQYLNEDEGFWGFGVLGF